MSSEEVFEGHSSEMKNPTEWLSVEDILGRGDVQAEIAKCVRKRNVKFEQGRAQPVVYALEFVGKKKRLIVNKARRVTLVRMYGPDVREWAGKTVTLYVDPDVMLAGKKVGGIRIRHVDQ